MSQYVSRCLKMSDDVMKCLKMSGGIASFKSKGKRCVLKDAPLRNEVAFIFPNNIYQQVKLVFVCCHFQLPLTQILFC